MDARVVCFFAGVIVGAASTAGVIVASKNEDLKAVFEHARKTEAEQLVKDVSDQIVSRYWEKKGDKKF